MTAKTPNGLKMYLATVGGTLTVALVIQTTALIWWASRIDTKVEYIEHGLRNVSERLYALEVQDARSAG